MNELEGVSALRQQCATCSGIVGVNCACEPESDSLSGPDGRTSFVGEQLAKELRRSASAKHETTDVRQDGYGPSTFLVRVLEGDVPTGLIATVTVEVRREGIPT